MKRLTPIAGSLPLVPAALLIGTALVLLALGCFTSPHDVGRMEREVLGQRSEALVRTLRPGEASLPFSLSSRMVSSAILQVDVARTSGEPLASLCWARASGALIALSQRLPLNPDELGPALSAEQARVRAVGWLLRLGLVAEGELVRAQTPTVSPRGIWAVPVAVGQRKYAVKLARRTGELLELAAPVP